MPEQADKTPDWLAAQIIELADIKPGMEVLDPCAGTGTLIKLAYKAGARVWAYELNKERREALRADMFSSFGAGGLAADFMSNMKRLPVFDRIVMNPPLQDIPMIASAFQSLAPGGRLVSVYCPDLREHSDTFYDLLREAQAYDLYEFPTGTFHWEGKDRPTSLVVLNKCA